MNRNEQFYEEYVDKAKQYVDFMITSHQYSSLDKLKVNKWISNFNIKTKEEWYFVYKLLSRMIFYSDTDIETLLTNNVKQLFTEVFLTNAQIDSNFSLTPQDIQWEFGSFVRDSIFVPVTPNSTPTDSGAELIRILKRTLQLNDENSKFHHDLMTCTIPKRVVFIDDTVGTGHQFVEYIQDYILSNGTSSILDWVNKNKVEIYYIPLVCMVEGLEYINKNLPTVRVVTGQLIDTRCNVFAPNSIYWQDEEELNRARDFFNSALKDYGINLCGYENLNLALILHNNIPDWSLPLLWKGINNWNPLVEREGTFYE